MGRRPVHPRSRGERSRSTPTVDSKVGSSPLARGTGDVVGKALGRERFIPARAGNGPPGSTALAGASVHPRSRGERIEGSGLFDWSGGSSPLARGTAWRSAHASFASRFIPARAGNGIAHNSPPLHASVHPRSRGERISRISFRSQPAGSSPLARGTDVADDKVIKCARFIPARAGNGGVPAAGR